MEIPSYLRSIDQTLNGTTSSAQVTVQPSPTHTVHDLKRVRFMLVSTHVKQYTGYSKISYGILQELAKVPNLELTHFGFQKHPQVPPDYRPYPNGVEEIDAAALEVPFEQGFAYKALVEVVKKKNPHVIMIYNDMAVVTRFLEEIRKVANPRPFKVWI